MPTSAPYPTVGTVLQRARVFCNDAGISLAGNLLSIAQPYTATLLEDAWEHLQEMLADAGSERLVQQAFLYGVPACGVQDPTLWTTIGYTSCSSGGVGYSGPLLPQDLISPIWVKERQSGLTAGFTLVHPTSDGLPSRIQGGLMREWSWLQDQLVFAGATQAVDLELRYNAYLAPLGSGEASLVPIMRCERALGYYTAAEFAASRGSTLADGLAAKGDQAVARMTSRIARVKQRLSRRRLPFSFFRGAGNF